MSKTACCFLALGISVAAFAAACGDDDGGDDGIGGGGGSGGSGAGGGAAGSAGMAGTGMGGDAGAGTAGTGGGGAGGTNAGGEGGQGTGGVGGTDSDPDGGVPDSGIVDDQDSGVVVDAGGPSEPVDSGVNGNCAGFATGVLTISSQPSQDAVIARVIFDPDDQTAHVTLRAVALFNFADPLVLCSGPEDEQCVLVDDDVIGNRPVGTELQIDIGDVGDPVSAEEGELALVNDLPSLGGFPIAYVNWNDFDSVDPDDPQLDNLATLAAEAGNGGAEGFWLDGESIDLGTSNALFGTGETNVAVGFGVCTADQF